MPKGKNHTSKRTTLHQKYKIQKKVREHRRKIRKDEKAKAKKGGGKLAARIRKDPGIPNLWPFKEQLLREVEEHKEQVAQDKIAAKVEMQKAKEKARLAGMSSAQQLAALKNSAQNRTSTFEMQEMDTKKQKKMSDVEHTRRAYYRELHKIMESADVILEVLDARDPMGCRPTEIENYIQQRDPNKRVILVLNKIDLVPKEVASQWLKVLRREYPTVALKCSTQSQKTNLGRSKTNALDASSDQLGNSECLGGEQLLQLLKNYSRNRNLKTSVTVGVIGYPNVGKSSLINSLVRTRAVEVGAQAGITKVAQEVHLDKKVKLLDCPGIVFAKDENDVSVILRNHVKLSAVTDCVPAVHEIVKRCDKMKLMKLYKIARFGSEQEFMQLVCQVRGKMKKGGVLDLEGGARSVLQDWFAGKIPYYTQPPVVAESSFEETSIVTTWGKEFDLASVGQVEVIDAACAGMDDAFISFKGLSLGAAAAVDMAFSKVDEMEEEMEEDEAPAVPKVGRAEKAPVAAGSVNKATKAHRAEAAAAAVRRQQAAGGDDSGSDYDFAEAFGGEEGGKFGALRAEGDEDEDDDDGEMSEEGDDGMED